MFKKLSSNLGRIWMSSGSASSRQDEPADHGFVRIQTPEQWWNGVPIPRFSFSGLYFLHFGRIFSHLVKLCPPELWLLPRLGFLLKMGSPSCLEAESVHAVKGAFQFEVSHRAVGCTMERLWLSLRWRTVSSSCPLLALSSPSGPGISGSGFSWSWKNKVCFRFHGCCIKGCHGCWCQLLILPSGLPVGKHAK